MKHFQRCSSAGVHDAHASKPRHQALKQLRPLINSASIAAAAGVVLVPVALAVRRVAHIVPEQRHMRYAGMHCQLYRRSAAIHERQGLQPVSSRANLVTPAGPGELWLLVAPPAAVYSDEAVGPGGKSVGVVCDDDASTWLRLAPRLDGFDVCSGEAWATGDADDVLPVAVVGFARGAIRPRC